MMRAGDQLDNPMNSVTPMESRTTCACPRASARPRQMSKHGTSRVMICDLCESKSIPIKNHSAGVGAAQPGAAELLAVHHLTRIRGREGQLIANRELECVTGVFTGDRYRARGTSRPDPADIAGARNR